jgi:type IV pilus assembly protein PilO
MSSFDWKDKKNIYAIVMAVILLALAGLYYQYLYLPVVAEVKSVDHLIKTHTKELNEINRQKKQKEKLEKQLIQAGEEFKTLKEMFPEQEEVPRRLQDLYAVIRSSGVTITDFTPKEHVTQEHYLENKYEISLTGGYHMLGYMFAEIANFKYPTAIAKLKVERYAGIDKELDKAARHGWTPTTMKVDFELTTFTSRKTQSKAKPQKTGKKAVKKK